ncbi:GNAT family N-acetyltransferase [Clostridium senegalense]
MLKHKGTKNIKTERLLLRKFKTYDVKDMFKNWASDSEVTKFLTWEPHNSINDTKVIIDQWVKEYKQGNIYNWAIELKETRKVIGGISIVKLEEQHSCCEIGYCIAKSYWKKGIATEALTAVIDYLFKVVNFNRIVAKYDSKNIGSGKVMIKSGMKYEGTLRQAKIRKNNKFYDLAIYAVLKCDWLEKDK